MNVFVCIPTCNYKKNICSSQPTKQFFFYQNSYKAIKDFDENYY